MTKSILKCIKCGDFSMEKICKCSGECISLKPAKYSPIDRFSKYRIIYKKKSL